MAVRSAKGARCGAALVLGVLLADVAAGAAAHRPVGQNGSRTGQSTEMQPRPAAVGSGRLRLSGVPPFLWTLQRGAVYRRTFALFGLVNWAEDRRRPDRVRRSTAVIPLVWIRRRTVSRGEGRPAVRRSDWIIPLLLASGHSSDAHGGYRRIDLLWPLIHIERGARDRREYVRSYQFLPFYAFRREWRVDGASGLKIPESESVRLSLLDILYSYRREGTRFRRWKILGGLVHSERVGARTIKGLLWGLYRREAEGGKRFHRLFGVIRAGQLEPLGRAKR